MERFDKGMAMRMKNAKLHPLRHKEGAPMMGRNFLKPFRMPDGPVKTLPPPLKTRRVKGVQND